MGILQYRLGKKHALAGIRPMTHRNHMRYDSHSANLMYHQGYTEGMKLRFQELGMRSNTYHEELVRPYRP
jgi:hypothetical protein